MIITALARIKHGNLGLPVLERWMFGHRGGGGCGGKRFLCKLPGVGSFLTGWCSELKKQGYREILCEARLFIGGNRSNWEQSKCFVLSWKPHDGLRNNSSGCLTQTNLSYLVMQNTISKLVYLGWTLHQACKFHVQNTTDKMQTYTSLSSLHWRKLCFFFWASNSWSISPSMLFSSFNPRETQTMLV